MLQNRDYTKFSIMNIEVQPQTCAWEQLLCSILMFYRSQNDLHCEKSDNKRGPCGL